MKISTIALVLGSALITCSAGAGLAACSSSSGTGEPSAPLDSGTDTSTGMDSGTQPDTGPGADTGTGGDTSTGDDGGDAGCTSPPALHISSADGGIYCPFSKNFDVDGGEYAYCTTGTQSCCLSPSSDAGLSVCTTIGNCATALPNSEEWQCAGPEDCKSGGSVCCLTSGPTEANAECVNTLKTKGFDNTRCMASQAACSGTVDAGMYTDNQFVVCEKQADCATGTCTALKTTGTSIGLCL
jgi:hypothetical protein